MGQEMQALNEIAFKVNRLEVLQETNTKAISDMAVSVSRLVDKLDKSDDIAREADHRAKTAHHRIDDFNRRLEHLNAETNARFKDIEADRKKLVGTAITIASLVITGVNALLNWAGVL